MKREVDLGRRKEPKCSCSQATTRAASGIFERGEAGSLGRCNSLETAGCDREKGSVCGEKEILDGTKSRSGT